MQTRRYSVKSRLGATLSALALLTTFLAVTPSAAMAAEAPVLIGYSADKELLRIDTTTGAAISLGKMSVLDAAASEIECAPTGEPTDCYLMEFFGPIRQFDRNTATFTGVTSSPSPAGTTFQGLEYVGGTLYGTKSATSIGSPSSLVTVNPLTGAYTTIGSTGVGPISGLAYDGATMYGIGGGGVANLYKINLATGVATLVGPTGMANAGSLQFAADGKLYAGGNVAGSALLPSQLWTINPATGAGTLVGATGFGQINGLTMVNVVAAPAGADTVGLVDISQGTWRLRNSAGAVTQFDFGNPGDLPIAGDWDGNGSVTPGLYRQSDGFFYSRNSNSTGIADAQCFAGDAADIPVVGDWDGDGDDNLGIYRPSEQKFYLFTSSCANVPMGAAQIALAFGNPGDKPVAGDWDGDGIDEIGLHRESTGFFYWRNTLDTGVASGEIFFGDPNDRFVAGDWGIVDDIDTPAIFRPSGVTFYFRHTLTQGNADSTLPWTGAGAGWLPVAGTFGLG